MFTVYVDRPQGNYIEIHRQIISQLLQNSAVREQKINLSESFQLNYLANKSGIDSLDLSIFQLTLLVPDQTLQMNHSHIALDSWLQGVKLRAERKKTIGNVSAEVRILYSRNKISL